MEAVLIHDTGKVNRAFEELKNLLKHLPKLSRGMKVIFREAGVLKGERPYLFLKPLSGEGWLIERTATGWVIARADKILRADNPDESFYLRSADEPWDIVTLHELSSNGGSKLPRVNSTKFGDALLPLSIYFKRLLESL